MDIVITDEVLNHFFCDKRILITGGAGFVGSHLVQKLVTVSNHVVCLDNYLSGLRSNHIVGASYVEGDVNNIVDILGFQKFDYIFHFGEYSRVELSLKEPHIALSNSYKSFPSLLKFWQSSGAKLIYSGSSTKFADNGLGRHLSPYTLVKSLNTELLVDFAKWYNLPFCIVYFYNVYGGRELRNGKYSTVIGKFKRLVSSGATKLPVTAPGTQIRYFTHIEDISSGILLAAGKGVGDLYGIGSDDSYSIIDLCRMFGCKPEIKQSSSANRMGGDLQTDKIKRLGWIPKYSLKVHIKKFMDEYTKNQ
jgi:UDP-glucose 4-epimerase